MNLTTIVNLFGGVGEGTLYVGKNFWTLNAVLHGGPYANTPHGLGKTKKKDYTAS